VTVSRSGTSGGGVVSMRPTADLTIPADFALLIPDHLQIDSGITVTIENGAVLVVFP
jgi:hypothetical protein